MANGSGGTLVFDSGDLRKRESPASSLLDYLKPKKSAKHGTDNLLLTCMDYRLTGHTQRYMKRRRLAGKFDHIVLAGASLGATCADVPEWGATFWAHLNTALSLHNIKTVILMDHTDCGAYKLFLKEQYPQKKKEQLPCHFETLKKLEAQILEKFPELKVEKHVMHVNGKVVDCKE